MNSRSHYVVAFGRFLRSKVTVRALSHEVSQAGISATFLVTKVKCLMQLTFITVLKELNGRLQMDLRFVINLMVQRRYLQHHHRLKLGSVECQHQPMVPKRNLDSFLAAIDASSNFLSSTTNQHVGRKICACRKKMQKKYISYVCTSRNCVKYNPHKKWYITDRNF